MREQLEPGQNDILQDKVIINDKLKQDLTENPEDIKVMQENERGRIPYDYKSDSKIKADLTNNL